MQVLLTRQQIRRRIKQLGREIARDYAGQPVTLLGVLTGCLMVVADLVRELPLATRIAFLQASSYRGATTTPGRLELNVDGLPDLHGRHVLLVDDILDTGRTLDKVIDWVRQQRPRSLRVAVFLRKRGRQEVAIEPDYCGFEIPDVFVVGYGLDYDGEFRNLPYVGILSEGETDNVAATEQAVAKR